MGREAVMALNSFGLDVLSQLEDCKQVRTVATFCTVSLDICVHLCGD